MSERPSASLAAILGCAGPRLSAAERGFFRDADPLGFILFARNIVDPAQVQALIAELRDAVGREAPVLLDQEGGRVQRLRPPHWRAAPSAGRLAALGAAADRAVWLNARLMAGEMAALGMDVDCAPVLDVPVPGAHAVIGDRAYGQDPAIVARLGRVAMDGLIAGGVLPVIKHIPGHGRAEADSHEHCPTVAASAAALEADLVPFVALADAPFAMTAHVVYPAWDAARVATLSPLVIEEVIRRRIGFAGALISDDLSMKALGGTLGSRARDAQAAGCDLVLHCNGDPAEMRDVVTATAPLSGAAATRVAAALARRRPPGPVDPAALSAELEALLAA